LNVELGRNSNTVYRLDGSNVLGKRVERDRRFFRLLADRKE
jgi:hypothetical protein